MAEHVQKSYSCDRCKAGIDGPGSPKGLYPSIKITASIHGEWSGYELNWIDICNPCWTEIHAFLGSPNP